MGSERLALLADRPFLRGLPLKVLEEIDAALESVHVRGGSRVIARGEAPAPFFLVMQGGLRASFVEGGQRKVVFECFRGGTAGEALVLTGQPSPLDVDAIRDSHLLRLAPEKFRAIAERNPAVSLSFARGVSARLVELLGAPEVLGAFSQKADRLPRSVALLAEGRDAARMRHRVIAALGRARTTQRLSMREPRESAMGAELVALECERTDMFALDYALRQADRILVLLDAGARALDVWRDAGLGERSAQVELAVVHPASAAGPEGGAEYRRLPGVTRVHHVKADERADAERLARWLLDRPVGLVLGGGGAYGIAHVGVLKALEEAGVPVDIVGGASMGAIFAGGVARRWSADRIMEHVRELFASRFALYDLTIPFTALLGGKKLDRVLLRFFEDLAIEDLWRPFFCVSTNISRAGPRLHDEGALRDAIRASCSIPGLFPPYQAAQQLLVDGGLVDNLPVDHMAARCAGPIVAVNVFPYRRPDGANGKKKSERRGFLKRMKPLAEAMPPLFDVLMRSTFVGSQHAVETFLAQHPPALYLVPEIAKFRILDWGAYEALFEAGYLCARRHLDAGELPRTLWEGHIEERVRVPSVRTDSVVAGHPRA
jgi:NTE family protein